MNMDAHHLRAYIVFLIGSIIFVGILAFLYLPNSSIRSDVFETNKNREKNSVEPVSLDLKVSQDVLSARRIKLTNMLLRFQAELSDLESRHTLTNSQDQEFLKKIETLKIKIENIQSMIKKLTE